MTDPLRKSPEGLLSPEDHSDQIDSTENINTPEVVGTEVSQTPAVETTQTPTDSVETEQAQEPTNLTPETALSPDAILNTTPVVEKSDTDVTKELLIDDNKIDVNDAGTVRKMLTDILNDAETHPKI